MSRVNDNFQSSGPSVADVTVEEGAIPVRVVDIILDESHPSFENYGDIGAIRYRALSETADEDSKQILPKAFPMNRSVFTFPFDYYKNAGSCIILEKLPPSIDVSCILEKSLLFYIRFR